MKRKFAVLTVLGALLALAVPASSMAGIYPASSQFEIAGGSTPPTVGTTLGSCPVTKVTGTTPASPANESSGSFPVTLTFGTCTSGTSITLTSSWSLTYPSVTNSYGVNMQGLGALRYSSLPGCKLSGTFILWGIWSNGLVTPKAMKSGYHADSYNTLTWADDGASCALSGKKETVRWSQQTVIGGPSGYPTSSQVNNLTTPAAPILVTP